MSGIAGRYALSGDSGLRARPTRFELRGCAGLCHRQQDPDPLNIDVHNVSIDGIAFSSGTWFEPGETLHLSFVGDPWQQIWRVEVIWCIADDDRGYTTGTRVARTA